MPTGDLYYRHSGRAPMGGVVAMLLVAGVAQAVIAAVYGALVFFSPFIYFNFLGTLGVGFVGGWLIRKIGMATHVRNLPVYLLAAAVVGLVGLYAAWVGWTYALLERSFIINIDDAPVSIFSPIALAYLIEQVGREGIWSIGSDEQPVRGMMLYAVWLVEAGILVISPIVVAAAVRGEAYCEQTGCWLSEHTAIGPFEPISMPIDFRTKMEDGNFGVIGELKPLDHEPRNGERFAMITLSHAGQDQSTHLLSLNNVELKLDKQGKAQLSELPIIRGMLIDRSTHELIRQVATVPADGEPAEVPIHAHVHAQAESDQASPGPA